MRTSSTSLFRLNVTLTLFFFFFTDPATTEIYTLSLHDALPICPCGEARVVVESGRGIRHRTSAKCSSPALEARTRSEEHTSELQSRFDLVCRLLLEKKKKKETMLVPLKDPQCQTATLNCRIKRY